MALLSEVVSNVRIKLQIRNKTNDTIIDSDISDAIDGAIKAFSTARGFRKVKDQRGNGLSAIPLPSDWDTISKITQLWISGLQSWEYRVEDKVDLSDRAIQNVANGTKNITCIAVTDAYFFREGDVVSLINNATEAEQNWIASDGNGVTGAIVLANATAGAYSTSPQLRRRPQIVLTKSKPRDSDLIRVHYTKTHVLTESENTIDAKDQDAFEHLCAAFTAQRISAKYANTQASPLSAEIDYQSKRAEWTAIYEKEIELYKEHIEKTKKMWYQYD